MTMATAVTSQQVWRMSGVLLALVLFLTACGNGETESEPESESEGDPVAAEDGSCEDPVTIGVALPLSGPYAETGRFIEEGYLDWAEYLNENEDGMLGCPIEVVVEDDTSEAGRSASLLERFITVEGVDLILGGYPTPLVAAQMPVAEQHGKVYIGMGGGFESFQQGYEYIFGAPPLMNEWWYNGFFEWVATLDESERPQRAAMVSANNPTGSGMASGVRDHLEELGIELVLDEFYDLPLASAEPFVVSAQGADADLFIANSFFDDGVTIVRAVRSSNYEPDAILQGVGTLIPSWDEELGEEGEYVISGSPMHPALPFGRTEVVNELAAERYDTELAPIYYMFGANWMDVLAQAVEGAGTLDDDEIAAWLRDNEIETIGGDYTFDERGLPEPFNYATQVQDGRARLVWPPEVAEADMIYPIP